jgi:hypothetical protein
MDIWVAIILAENTEDMLLALERIGSHSVECHFGTTRSTLSGDTRRDSFFKAQVKAVLIQRTMADLSLPPCIRRFKSDPGCTLFGRGDQGSVPSIEGVAGLLG